MTKIRRPNELLLPTTDLSMKQLAEASEKSEAMLAAKPTSPRHPTASSRPALEGPVKDAAGAPRVRKRRGFGAGPLPQPKELNAGWSDLLSEISASGRRVRVARGGHIGMQGRVAQESPIPRSSPESPIPRSALVTQEQLSASLKTDKTPQGDTAKDQQQQDQIEIKDKVCEEHGVDGQVEEHEHGEADNMNDTGDDLWKSYRIDSAKVPDSVLATIWRRAVDPKHCTETVPILEKVPRLNVTKREVEQLPAVNDIQHWRQVNKRSKEQAKAKEEAEHNPSLHEMMVKIFGQSAPPKLRMMKLKELVVAKDLEEEMLQAGIELSDDIVENQVFHEMLNVAFPQAELDLKTIFHGVMQKGRRNAFDEGQPWHRNNVPLAELQQHKASGGNRKSKLLGVLEAAKSLDENDNHLDQVAQASVQVQEKCDRKVRRMHTNFLKKQGQLSSRLTRRVKRLRMDYEEIHDMKMGSILPSVVSHKPGSKPGTGKPRSDDVLRYLKRHRHLTEKLRANHHGIYLQQVEKFQGYLRLLADPNRAPEKGEVYLSDCFKYVLAAGLIVDDDYFFRVLDSMELDEFEKVGTVNLLAACCQSFDIDLRRYCAFLKGLGVPLYKPRPRPDLVRGWEDWAPWNGVDLQSAEINSPDAGELDSLGGEDCPDLLEDPFPFGPIVPDGPANASELVSRDDPLSRVLQQVTFDMVLQRYGLSRNSREQGGASADELRKALDAVAGGDTEPGDVRQTGDNRPVPQISEARTAAGTSAQVVGSAGPAKPTLPPRTRPSPRRNLNLSRMRAAAEPLNAMPGAPDKDRPRAAAQASAMAPIVERPLQEVLE